MVQEVQQQGNWYQTPNEIQGIWDTRRRVREHTQVSPFFSYECTATWSVTIHFPAYQTVEEKGTITSISSSYGDTKFRRVSWGLYIPLAWAYLVQLSGSWWTAYVHWTHTIRIGTHDIISVVSTSWTSVTTSKIINFWRWNLLEYYGKAANTTEWGATWTYGMTLNLKKL